MPTCLPLDDPDNYWKYCPNFPAAIIFAILFGFTSSLHIVQAFLYRKTFCWVLIMGALWEFVALLFRAMSINDPTNQQYNRTTFVFLILAPMWINAFDYMVLGRMIYFYLPEKSLAKIPGRRLAVYFVLADITSFIIQLGGALMSLGTDLSAQRNGLHIYTGGVCLQETVILIFLGLGVVFYRRLVSLSGVENLIGAKKLVIALYVSLVLISLRICFRIIEFSAGVDTPLNNTIEFNEWFVYVFDIAPMFLALIIFNIFHPGKVLVGPAAEYEKLTREEKKAMKEAKKRAKMEGNSANFMNDHSVELTERGSQV